MRSPWTSVLLLVVVALVTSACATKGWVNEVMGKKSDQIDQRFARTDATITEVGDGARVAKSRADEAFTRAETAQTRADNAFGRADAAHGRADAAYGRADEVNTRLSRLWNGRHKRDLVETLHVQFGFDRADLTDGAQTALLQITKELKDNPLLTVDLEGYTDPTGPREYNVGLSQRRVESVRRFLVGNGADLGRINSIGLGVLPASKEQHALQRRVTVRLMINAMD